MPKIKFKLSTASINQAIAELEAYKQNVKDKTVLLRKRLAEELAKKVEAGFNGAIYDDLLYEGMSVPNVRVEVTHNQDKSIVIAHGKEAVFAEFGAGVYYNGPVGSFPHPNTPAGIVAIGKYGHGYGAREIWGFYDMETGEFKLTHGTPASMPMYYALQELAQIVPQIAREVFRQ